MNADILQRMIVERCQFGDRRPHAPLGAHPCPEPDNRGRGLCDRTGRSVLHACRLAGILRLPRGACTQPLRLTPMLKLGWPATLRIQLRFLTVDEVARVDKAWVHGFAVGREGFDEMGRQPGYGCGELVPCCVGLRARRSVLSQAAKIFCARVERERRRVAMCIIHNPHRSLPSDVNRGRSCDA